MRTVGRILDIWEILMHWLLDIFLTEGHDYLETTLNLFPVTNCDRKYADRWAEIGKEMTWEEVGPVMYVLMWENSVQHACIHLLNL
jgi:hypothetical protein